MPRARSGGLNVSRLAAGALAEELDRQAKIAELDAYLRELEAEHGKTSERDRAAARQWADEVVSVPAPAPPTCRPVQNAAHHRPDGWT